MSIESDLEDILSRMGSLERLVEALTPEPMTMNAAIELSAGNKAKTDYGNKTFIVTATALGYSAYVIENGKGVGFTSQNVTLEDVGDLYSKFGYRMWNHIVCDLVWIPV